MGKPKKYFVHSWPKWRDGERLELSMGVDVARGPEIHFHPIAEGVDFVGVDVASGKDKLVWFHRWGKEGVFKMEKAMDEWSDDHLDKIIERKELRRDQCMAYKKRCVKRLKKAALEGLAKETELVKLHAEKEKRETGRPGPGQMCSFSVSGNGNEFNPHTDQVQFFDGVPNSARKDYEWPEKFAHFYLDHALNFHGTSMGHPNDKLVERVDTWVDMQVHMAKSPFATFVKKFSHYWYDKEGDSLPLHTYELVERWTAHKVKAILDK